MSVLIVEDNVDLAESMRMLLEKTFLKVDVAWIDVRVSKRVQAELAGKTVKKAIYVPGKIVTLVVG